MKIEICDKCRQTIGFEIKYLRLFEKIHEKIESLEKFEKEHGSFGEFSTVASQKRLLKSLLEGKKDVL